jgi:hypothetical protein
MAEVSVKFSTSQFRPRELGEKECSGGQRTKTGVYAAKSGSEAQESGFSDGGKPPLMDDGSTERW